MAMTAAEMEAAIIDLQMRMTAMESRADAISTYPFVSYTDTDQESIGGGGPTGRSGQPGSTTQIWKTFDKIKKAAHG